MEDGLINYITLSQLSLLRGNKNTVSPSSKISSKFAFYRHLHKDPVIKIQQLVFKYFPPCLRLSESLNVSCKNQFPCSSAACTRQNTLWYFKVLSRNSKTDLFKRMERPCLNSSEALVLIHTCITLKAWGALDSVPICHSATSPAPTQGHCCDTRSVEELPLLAHQLHLNECGC